MKSLTFFLILTTLVTQISCSKNRPALNDSERKKAQTLYFNLKTEPPTLDWNKVEDTTSRVVIDNIMESLISYDYSTAKAKLVPGLATSWISKAGGKIWELTLRKGVRWSDGVEFKGEHVYNSFQRLLTPATAAMGSDDIHVIKNAKAFNLGTITDFSKVGIRLDGDQKIIFELEKPIPFFPYILSLPQISPIRKDLIDKHGALWTHPKNLVTLGAYRLKRWRHDESITLEANPDYFGPAPQVKEVHLRMISEDSTAVNLFETGRLDVQSSLPSLDLKRLTQKKEYSSFTNSCVAFLVFNLQLPPMDDIWVRRAIVQAIDRAALIKLLGGGRKLNKGWLPEGILGYDPSIGLDYNPKQARIDLSHSKYKTGKAVPKIQIYYNTSNNYKQLFELIQSQLQTNLGITVELHHLEWKSYLSLIRSKMPHIHRMGWIGTYQDPDVMMRPLMGGTTSINSSWKNEKYNSLVLTAMSESSPEKRVDLYRQANRIVAEQELPIFNIYTCAQQYLISPKISYYPYNKEARDVFRFVRYTKEPTIKREPH